MNSATTKSGSRLQACRPQVPADWEYHKNTIADLYVHNTLKAVIKIMESEYKFKATSKQYTTWLKRWGLDKKYIKSTEYKAMSNHKRTQKQRASRVGPQFYLHGKKVNDLKLSKWERRMFRQRKTPENGTLFDIVTPTRLILETRTPSPDRCLSEDQAVVSVAQRILGISPQSASFASSPGYIEEVTDRHCPDKMAITHMLSTNSSQHQAYYLSRSSRHYLQLEEIHKAISGSVLYQGTAEDLLSLSNTTQDRVANMGFRSLPSPILDTEPLQPNSPRLCRSPSLSPHEWWTPWTHFASTPTQAVYLVPPRHELEEIIRTFGRKVDTYEAYCIISDIIATFGNCPEDCLWCCSYGMKPSTSNLCVLERVNSKIWVERDKKSVSLEDSRHLFANAIFQLLPSSDVPPQALVYYAQIIADFEKDSRICSAVLGYLDNFLDPSSPGYRDALCDVARIHASVERWIEAHQFLRRVLGDAYEEISLLSEKPNMEAKSLAEAITIVTEKRIKFWMDDSGASWFTFVGSPREMESSWFVEEEGRVNTLEITIRACALQTMLYIKTERRQDLGAVNGVPSHF